MYNAVVFDMDGVIFDSERLVIECWVEIAKKYGMQNIEEACYECLGLNKDATREKMLLRYGEDFPYEEYAKEASNIYHSRYDDGRLPLKQGIFEILEYLKKENKKIALASSTRSQVVVKELTDAGLIKYFDEVIGGDMVTKSKPNPEIFLKACKALDEEPAMVYGIEDSYNGVRGLFDGGLRAIMVPDLAMPDDEMKEKCEVILDSLTDVINYLKQIEKN